MGKVIRTWYHLNFSPSDITWSFKVILHSKVISLKSFKVISTAGPNICRSGRNTMTFCSWKICWILATARNSMGSNFHATPAVRENYIHILYWEFEDNAPTSLKRLRTWLNPLEWSLPPPPPKKKYKQSLIKTVIDMRQCIFYTPLGSVLYECTTGELSNSIIELFNWSRELSNLITELSN